MFTYPTHSIHCRFSQLVGKIISLDETNTVFTSDCSFHLDGSLHRVITDAGKPNGVCISPDQKTLYVVSNDNGTTGIGRLPKDAPLAKGRMADEVRILVAVEQLVGAGYVCPAAPTLPAEVVAWWREELPTQ